MLKKLIIVLMIVHQIIGMDNNNNTDDQELDDEICTICAEPLRPMVQICQQKHFMHIDCHLETKKKWQDKCPCCMEGKTIVSSDANNNNSPLNVQVINNKTFELKHFANNLAGYDFVDFVKGKKKG